MILSNQSSEVIWLLDYFDCLNDMDKLNLAILFLESNFFCFDYKKEILIVLESSLSQLNGGRYVTKSLLFLSAKIFELSGEDEKKFFIEMLYNIYMNDFLNQEINNFIRKNLSVYEYYYALLGI